MSALKITKAVYAKGAVEPSQYPQDAFTRIAVVGKSNVGKSSMINRLLGVGGLAKTSSTPGKTRIINFFTVNDSFYLVDLPGYGFAKAPKSESEKWGRMMSTYFSEDERLELILMLVDIRHLPTQEDHRMLDMLEHYEIPTVLVATKADKLSKQQQRISLKAIRDAFDLDESLPILPFSSLNGQGRSEVLSAMGEFV